jgi:hypothetical protein
LGEVEGEEIEESPRILGDVGGLADAKNRSCLYGSMILLTILNDFHGIDTMKTTELKQALEDSGIDKDGFNNLNQLDKSDVYLSRKGSGASGTTTVRPPGMDEARILVEDMLP